jgi:hypothetical protein
VLSLGHGIDAEAGVPETAKWRRRPAATRRPPAHSVALEVEITDPSLAEDLADALRRIGFHVLRTGEATLVVRELRHPEGPEAIEGAAERELDLYLQVWEVTHPGVRATRVG